MKAENWPSAVFLLVFAAALLWAAAVTGANKKLKAQVADQTACAAFLSDSKGGVAAKCSALLAGLHDRDADAAACTADLSEGTLNARCPTAVAGLYHDRAALQTQLNQVVKDRDASIARAAARATTSQNRKAQDEKSLQSAAVDPDGLRVCDAGCLRSRFETVGS